MAKDCIRTNGLGYSQKLPVFALLGGKRADNILGEDLMRTRVLTNLSEAKF